MKSSEAEALPRCSDSTEGVEVLRHGGFAIRLREELFESESSLILSRGATLSSMAKIMPGDRPRDLFEAEECAEVMKALSKRLRIIDILRAGPRAVTHIAELLEVEPELTSHHLKILKQAELIDVERDGRFKIYRLRDGLLSTARGPSGTQFLNFGCCRLEVPERLNADE